MKLLWSHSSRRAVSLFLAAITMVYLTGCNSYQVLKKEGNYIKKIESMQATKKLFLHNGNEVFQIKNYTVFNKTDLRLELAHPVWDTITVIQKAKKSTNMAGVSQDMVIDTVTYPPYYYANQDGFFQIQAKEKEKIPYRKYSSILKEVHIYTNSYLAYLTIGENVLSIYQVQQVRIIEDGSAKLITATIGVALLILLLTSMGDYPAGLSFPYDFFLPG
ncbi:MAG: hypothetical protein H6555_03295 [Lewinellaceae bacterium]|nr:hypothetical protein [Lewinellaceae bacterium]